MNEAIDVAGEWSYANKTAYEGPRTRVDALLDKEVLEEVLHILLGIYRTGGVAVARYQTAVKQYEANYLSENL